MFKPNVITSTSSYRLIISEKRNKGITNLVRILHGLERYPVVAHGAVPDHPFAPHLDQQSSVQVVCFAENRSRLQLKIHDESFCSLYLKMLLEQEKIKKIERAVINTLQLATRKNLIQMSPDVIYNSNCHY
jgi:hypothetical protein